MKKSIRFLQPFGAMMLIAVLTLGALSACTLFVQPTATPLPTATSLSTATETPLPTATLVPTATPTPTDTPMPTDTATPVPTDTPVPTETPDRTATAAVIATESAAVVLAQIQKDLEPYNLTLDEGQLVWQSNGPTEISMNSYGEMLYKELEPPLKLGNFIAKFDITWSSTSGLAGCGMIFRADKNLSEGAQYQFVTLRLSGAPGWDIEYWNYGAWDHTVTGKVKFSDLINLEQNSTNSYIIQIVGDEFSVYANGGRMGTFYSTKQAEGTMAVLGWQESGETTCKFDNVWVWELP
jgi:hypothetical protein